MRVEKNTVPAVPVAVGAASAGWVVTAHLPLENDAMLKTRTDIWRLALFTSLGLCPNACGGKADSDANESDRVNTPEGFAEAGTTNSGTTATTSEGESTDPSRVDDAGQTTSETLQSDGGNTGEPSRDGGSTSEPAACVELIRAGVDTGLLICDDGVVHRPTAAHLCQSSLPRPAPQDASPQDAGVGAEEQNACQSDADCTEQPHGYCDYTFADSPYQECQYGCTSDADCASDQACVCGDPVGQCVSASCREDADCAPGMKCAEWTDANAACSTRRLLTCQTPEDECASDADCAQETEYGRFCSGASEVRQCENQSGAVCGRPFLVAGSERLATLIMSDAWTGPLSVDGSDKAVADDAMHASIDSLTEPQRLLLGQRWAQLGLMEHASIAAFARFTLQLLHLGAPANLVEDAQRAMSDETQHARDCFALASRYLGHSVGPSALHMDQALQETSLEDIVRLTVREGCIGETCAALEAAEAYEATIEPRAKTVLERIRADEFRHAELAWQFVSWALTQGAPNAEAKARLHDVVAAEFVAAAHDANILPAAPIAANSFDTLPHGIVPASLLPEIRRTALRDVVLPCAQELLRSVQQQQKAETTVLNAVV